MEDASEGSSGPDDEQLTSKSFLAMIESRVGLSIFATVPVATFVSSFLNKISTLSPTFKLDLSISSVNKTILEPDIF